MFSSSTPFFNQPSILTDHCFKKSLISSWSSVQTPLIHPWIITHTAARFLFLWLTWIPLFPTTICHWRLNSWYCTQGPEQSGLKLSVIHRHTLKYLISHPMFFFTFLLLKFCQFLKNQPKNDFFTNTSLILESSLIFQRRTLTGNFPVSIKIYHMGRSN